MRNIKGFVFRPHIGDYWPLFGAPAVKGDKFYSNLVLNNVTPYKRAAEAQSGAKSFVSRHAQDVSKMDICALEMRIAESFEEGEEFSNKSGIIVIQNIEENGKLVQQEFFGPVVEGKKDAYPFPCAFLYNNGHVSYTKANSRGKFSAYERACYVAREVNRQGQSGAMLALYRLHYIRDMKLV